jgi:hypothetical protein
MLVSKTTGAGHFRSEWILMTALSIFASLPPVSATDIFGATASATNSSASNTPPTNKKYRAKSISVWLHPRPLACTTLVTGDGADGS